MILMAPAEPRDMKGLPSGSRTIVGDIEERGRLPGSGALTLAGS